jgi:hypothetical protein
MNRLVSIIPSTALPTLIAPAGDRAEFRFLEFFAANIRNPYRAWLMAGPWANS